MSKIGIVGDLHISSVSPLGHIDSSTQINSRLIDFINTFDGIVDKFEQNKVKYIAIAGDCMDSRSPSTVAINAFAKSIKRAVDKNMKVVIIAGNHDISRSSKSTTIDIFDSLKVPNVSVFTDFGIKTFDDFSFILLPYKDRKQLQSNSNEEAVEKIEEFLKTTNNLNGKKIVLSHLMAEDTIKDNSDDFSINEIVVPLKMFDKFDFSIFGHIHNFKILKQNPPMVNIGSMEKLNFGDINQEKKILIIDTENINNYQLLNTKVREFFEINFDYTDKIYKTDITDKIIDDFEKYASNHNLKDAIVRLVAQMKNDDIYFVNQDRIKERILREGVDTLANIHIISNSSRKLRDEYITEEQNAKKAFGAFIKNLPETDNIKKQLLKTAEQIIEEVDGK